MSRPVAEPGGILLVGVGLSAAQLQLWMAALHAEGPSLTVLVGPDEQLLAQAAADEVWVYGPLGLRGMMALLRRLAWRRFQTVYQPSSAGLAWLRFFVVPRPAWRRPAQPPQSFPQLGG